MSGSEWDAAWGTDYDGDDCQICEPFEEHTDRQALQAEHDNDNAVIDAAMGDNA